MSPPCKISGELKLGSNQNNDTFIWYIPEQRWLSMEEFAKCDIGDDVKIVLKIQTEKVKKNAPSNNPISSSIPFNNNYDYSLSLSPLKLDDMGVLKYEEIQQPIDETERPVDTLTTSISDLFVGGAATIAMALSIAQQIRQKKKEAEANICCNNNKIEISKFDAKLQKLETEMKTSQEKENKGMIAEILETRKEIKDIKSEFESAQEDVKKLVDIIDLQMKNKQ